MLALVSDWITRKGNSSSISTKFCHKHHLFLRLHTLLVLVILILFILGKFQYLSVESNAMQYNILIDTPLTGLFSDNNC